MLTGFLLGYLGLAGCGGDSNPPPPPKQPSLYQTVSLVEGTANINHSVRYENLNNVSVEVSHNSTKMYDEPISYSPYNKTLEKMLKGDWGFKATGGNLSKINSITVPNYLPTFNSSGLGTDLNQRYGGSSITVCGDRLLDTNLEDMPVSLNTAESLDGRTIISRSGDDCFAISANGAPGAYTVQINYGSDAGGRDSSTITGNIIEVPEQIAFWSNRDQGTGELYLGDLDLVNNRLVNIRRLTNNLADDVWPDWSPDGKKIVFVSNSDLKNLGVWKMDANGNNKVKLTPDNIIAVTPTWCSDNQVYFGFRDDFGKTGIAKISPDGTGFMKLVEEPFLGTYTPNPTCAPSRLEMAFSTSRNGNSEIYKVNIDGSNQRNLTNNPNADSQPRWSPVDDNNPNGRIAFISERDRGSLDIYIMAPDGTNIKRLTMVVQI